MKNDYHILHLICQEWTQGGLLSQSSRHTGQYFPVIISPTTKNRILQTVWDVQLCSWCKKKENVGRTSHASRLWCASLNCPIIQRLTHNNKNRNSVIKNFYRKCVVPETVFNFLCMNNVYYVSLCISFPLLWQVYLPIVCW